MVLVEIRSPVLDRRTHGVVWRTRATVRAEAGRFEIHGDDILDPGIPVQVPGGCRVAAADHPEEWARNLPSALRSGDLVAVVIEDTSAPEAAADPADDDDREEPPVPAPRFTSDTAEHTLG